MRDKTNGMRKQAVWILVCVILLTAAAASAKDLKSKDEAQAPTTPVTVTTAESANLEVWQSSVGQVDAITAPMVAAEVSGRVLTVVADEGQKVKTGQVLAKLDKTDFFLAEEVVKANIRRLKSLTRAKKLKVDRLRKLVQKRSASQASLDDAEAEFGALKAEIASTRVGLKQARQNIIKADIVSPVSGRIDDRRISVGDYVQVGTPLFHITARKYLKVRLPFPERLGPVLKIGLPVKLVSPVEPSVTVDGKITKISPLITRENRSIEVIIDIRNPGNWEPGASVSGKVQVAVHKNAVIVPEISVVRRPAGTVVYIIENGAAKQRVVKTGLRQDGKVEILTGLEAGEKVAVDGAGFLTDGVSVEVKKP